MKATICGECAGHEGEGQGYDWHDEFAKGTDTNEGECIGCGVDHASI